MDRIPKIVLLSVYSLAGTACIYVFLTMKGLPSEMQGLILAGAFLTLYSVPLLILSDAIAPNGIRCRCR